MMSINPDDVFAKLEADRASGKLSQNMTTAKVTYQASLSHPGYIEQINEESGERLVGTFTNGAFTPIEVESLPVGAVGREFGGADFEYD